MILFPNAKINLGLNIVSKRPDGYHNLETIFYPLPVKDALEVILSTEGKDSFNEAGLKVDSIPENNLVIKALRLLREEYNIPPVEVHLLKKIPFGAGIGGGSADAAFMLRLLNEQFSLGISNEKLVRLAAELGADCPFFIYNTPMFASGIGEILEPVELSLDNYYLVLVKPDIHVSTKDAFALVKPQYPEMSLKVIAKSPIEEWKKLMYNDFEKSIFSQYPEIGRIKEKLYSLGAVYASMSGSGSSVYAVFDRETDIKEEFTGCYVWEERK